MPKVHQPTKAQQNQRGTLSRDAYEAGTFVSVNKYVVNTTGRLLSGYGRAAPNNQFHGITIFHDATGLIWAENQVSLGAVENLMAKECCKQWSSEEATAEICHHSNNGISNAELFVED